MTLAPDPTAAPLGGEPAWLALSDQQRDHVRDAVASALGEAMDCTRVWSAWGYGTMSEDDFESIAEDHSRLDEICSAACCALSPSASAEVAGVAEVEKALHPCGDGCRYAKDVCMWPEHSCAECRYDQALDEAQDLKAKLDDTRADLAMANEELFFLRAGAEDDRATIARQADELRGRDAELERLRGLSEKATGGRAAPDCPSREWKASGRYIGTRNHMSYIGEVRDQNGNWSDTEKSTGDAAFIAAAVNFVRALLAPPRSTPDRPEGGVEGGACSPTTDATAAQRADGMGERT